MSFQDRVFNRGFEHAVFLFSFCAAPKSKRDETQHILRQNSMADSNEQNTEAGNVSDADILAALEAGDHIPAGEAPESTGEVDETEETDSGAEAETTQDQPSGENAEETTEAEAGEEAPEGEQDTGEETDEAEESKPPKGIADMQKRIDKITAVRKSLEEENSALKAQLQSAQPIKLAATADDPLADLNSPQEIQERVDQMVTLTDWCYENLDGGEAEGSDGKVIEYTAKDVRQRLATAQKMLNIHIPARLQYLRELTGWQNATRAVYPTLFDSKSQDSQIANQFLRECPAIMKSPRYQMIIGDAIRGMRDRLAKQEAAKTPKKEPIAPRATKPSQPAQRVASKQTNGNPRLARKFEQSGRVDDLAALIESTL